jgi:hypothetical protein
VQTFRHDRSAVKSQETLTWEPPQWELTKLTFHQRLQRAIDVGIPKDEIDAACASRDPKESLLQLIAARKQEMKQQRHRDADQARDAKRLWMEHFAAAKSKLCEGNELLLLRDWENDGQNGSAHAISAVDEQPVVAAFKVGLAVLDEDKGELGLHLDVDPKTVSEVELLREELELGLLRARKMVASHRSNAHMRSPQRDRRGPSPRQQRHVPSPSRRARSPNRGAALKRLATLSQMDEIGHLKRGLKAYNYRGAYSTRGFADQDPRQVFRDFCRQGIGADSGHPNALNYEQFLSMCRRGGKVQIRKGSSQEEDIRALFDALDLDGDKLVTIDEVVAFVWEEPLHETLDPLSSATSGSQVWQSVHQGLCPWEDSDSMTAGSAQLARGSNALDEGVRVPEPSQESRTKAAAAWGSAASDESLLHLRVAAATSSN